MVAQLKQDPKNIYLEIEGHTDNVGTPQINERVGLERHRQNVHPFVRQQPAHARQRARAVAQAEGDLVSDHEAD